MCIYVYIYIYICTHTHPYVYYIYTEYWTLCGMFMYTYMYVIYIDCTDDTVNFNDMRMKYIQSIGRDVGCYKVILDCSEDNVEFYNRT